VSLAEYHRRLESIYFMSTYSKICILWCVMPYRLVSTYWCVSSLLSFDRNQCWPFNKAHRTRIFINTPCADTKPFAAASKHTNTPHPPLLLPPRGIKWKRIGGTSHLQLACHLVTSLAAVLELRRNVKVALEQKRLSSGPKKLAKSAMDCIWFSSLAKGAVNCKSSLIITNPH